MGGALVNAVFTPGPWQIWPDANHPGNVRVVSFHPSAIAKVYADEAVSGDEKALANGNLIAAAPELYEALRQLASNAEIAKAHLPADASIISSALFDTISQAESVLAKARGEQ